MDARTPVFVLTGFLGSGKSTLLARCIREPGMRQTVVVVNEFGEVGLDHMLVTTGGNDTVVLDSGCLCCLGSDVLADTLMLLHARRKRGEIPSFERVVIETSGLADPVVLMETLLADPVTIRNFRLAGVITVVDGMLGAGELEEYPEARRQVGIADRIVITKGDIATEGEIEATRAQVYRLNGSAKVIERHSSFAASHEILGLDDGDSGLSSQLRLSHEHEHTLGISSHVFHMPRIANWQDYADWLAALRTIDADRLLRTKGLVRLDDGHLYIVQGVRHVFSAPVRHEGPQKDPFLVMIVRDLDRTLLERAFPSQ